MLTCEYQKPRTKDSSCFLCFRRHLTTGKKFSLAKLFWQYCFTLIEYWQHCAGEKTYGWRWRSEAAEAVALRGAVRQRMPSSGGVGGGDVRSRRAQTRDCRPSRLLPPGCPRSRSRAAPAWRIRRQRLVTDGEELAAHREF